MKARVAALAALVGAGTAALGAAVLAEAAGANRVALLVAGGVLLVGLVVLLTVRLFGPYVREPRRMAGDARLIVAANAGHRLDVRRPGELADLAAAVNELAQRYEAAESDAAAQVAAGRADLARERNRLAALMSELTAAVLVCNADGRILLYNAAARRLLEDRPDRPGVVGLGRSVFGVIDRELVAHVLERSGGGDPVQATTTWGERVLRVQVAPVGMESTGFVVLVDDVTRRLAATRHRDALLRDLTEGVRGAAAAIRGAVENLLEYPDLPADQRARFVRIIGDEAVVLSARVDELMRRSADHLTDRSLHEDISAADLLAAVAAAVEAENGPVVAVDAPADGVWLTLDGYAAARAVAALLTRVRTEHGVAQVRLDVAPGSGGLATLTARWAGPPVDPRTVREWTAGRMAGTGPGTIADVLAQHDAEVWSQAEAGGTAYLRVLLPLAGDPHQRRPATAPPAAAAAVDETAQARPEFYDFDLFEAAGGDGGWDDRPLDAIAYTVFDTETTGLQPAEGDEIIAIGAVRLVNGRLLRQETFDRLVDPRRPVPAAARRIHGLTGDMLRGQPTIDEVLPAFARFAEDTVLVGHNVSFDLAFLRRPEARTGIALGQPVLDTLLLSSVLHSDHDDHSMEAIAARLGVEVVGRHSALGDALLTGELFVRMLPLLRNRGIRTVGEAREAARRTYHARLDEAHYGAPGPR